MKISGTIAVFGATGATGSEVVRLAIEQGYVIQALARSPSKMKMVHPDIAVTVGDFANAEAIKAVVKGADYVVCCAGGNPKEKPFKRVMAPFVQLLWPIMEAEPSVKVFLYQAGAFASIPGEAAKPFMMKIMKSVVNCIFDFNSMLQDNQDVIDFVRSQPSTSLKYIITRPGMLKEGKSQAKYHGADKPYQGTTTFTDLALFTLAAIKDSSYYGKLPYPTPVKK